jgi:hypothetical protein
MPVRGGGGVHLPPALAVGVSERRARALRRAGQPVISRLLCGSAQIFTNEIEQCAQAEGSRPETTKPADVNPFAITRNVRLPKKRAAGGGAGRRGHGVMEVQIETRRLWGAPSLEHYE